MIVDAGKHECSDSKYTRRATFTSSTSLMDQTSFRKLLQTPNASLSSSAGASSAHVRGSLLVAATAGKSKKAKTIDASQPAFKPRQLKKGAKGETYRNRAEERRIGAPNDYAQVSIRSTFALRDALLTPCRTGRSACGRV